MSFSLISVSNVRGRTSQEFTCAEEKEGRFAAYTNRRPEELLPLACVSRPFLHLLTPAKGSHLSDQQVRIYSIHVDKAPRSGWDAISTMYYNKNAQDLPKQDTSKHLPIHEGFP